MRQIREMGVIQIDVTNKCNGPACSNCTRMLAHQRRRWEMSLENFRLAVDSLADFPGIVGVFGGNPCLHSRFAELADYLARRRDRGKCGIWTNDYREHGTLCAELFSYHNYNRHDEAEPSYHCPPMVAIRDLVPDEQERRILIDKCPVNAKWSACITELAGEARAYFCEIAAAFDHVYGVDHGKPVYPGWWDAQLCTFAAQINRWCDRCGMALPYPARRDRDRIDDVSRTHLGAVHRARKIAVADPDAYDLAGELVGWAEDPLDYKLLRTRKGERNLRR